MTPPILQQCVDLWGKAEVRQGAPPISFHDDVVYVPYQHGEAWGLFGADGTPIEGSVDLHGPLGQPHAQKLAWLGSTEAAAPEQTYVYGGVFNPHYGHFLINSLCRLWPLATQQARQHKILFHADGPADSWFVLPFVREIFDALGLTIDSLATFDHTVRIARVIVPSVSFQEQHFAYTAFRDLCHRIGEGVLGRFEPKPGLPPVYLTRPV